MIQEIRWNTIPAANEPLPDHMCAEAFTLNHWRLYDLGEGVSLEGHIYGRPGYPDGLQISTSFLSRYYRAEGLFYFETSNSIYACALQEYMLESDSLSMLDQLPADSIVQELEETRKQHYRDILRERRLACGVFLNWCGCDSPYLKETAYVSDGEVCIEDSGFTHFEASALFMLNEAREIAVRCASSPRSKIFLPTLASDDCPVFIENTGPKPLLASLQNGQKPLYISPGTCAAVKISFEPVYSVL